MESLAALGVAAAVVQFLNFGSRLFTTTWDTYRDATGQSQDLKDFNIIARDFKRWISPIRNTLKRSVSKTTQRKGVSEVEKIDDQLRPLCVACDEIARELEKVLPKTIKHLNQATLTTDTKASRGTRFDMALEQYWNREKISSMERRILELQGQVMSILLSTIWLATRDLPQNLEAFSQKQDEMMRYLRTKLEEGQNTGPVIETEIDPKTKTRRNDFLLDGDLLSTDFFERVSTQLFDRGRPPRELTMSSFDKHEQFLPESSAGLVISFLMFEYSSQREASIPDPHADTYSWALKSPLLSKSGELKWSDFPEWLSTVDEAESARAFWITGKPGAGKSTMLKFLANHEETKKHLDAWAGEHSLEVLTYYAWSPGGDLSKSINGLLRTFLCQILSRHTDLVPLICPRQWEYVFYARSLERVFDPPAPTWALEESFERLLSITEDVFKFKIAIFIDGLDEFQEAPQAFCDVVQKLASHPLVKICVASREWKEFNYAFKTSPTIRMHELTEDAIRDFVTARFTDPTVLPRVERLRKQPFGGSNRIDKMVDHILSNASGVFLWVTLVTNVVIRTLADQEPLEAVERKLRSMPPEMEGLYDAILDSIPPTLQQSTAWTLLFYKAKIVPTDNSSLVFYFADESRGSQLPFDPTDKIDHRIIFAEVEDRLVIRTRGILRQIETSHTALIRSRSFVVDAVHRTAAEWLAQSRVVERLEASAGVLQLHASYFWAFTYLIASGNQYFTDDITNTAHLVVLDHDAHGLVTHASRAESKEIDTATLIHFMAKVAELPRSPSIYGNLIHYCLSAPMLSYLKYVSQQKPRFFLENLESIGAYSFYSESDMPLTYITRSPQHLDVLRYLLEEGFTKQRAERFVEKLFSICREGEISRDPFDELLKQHFGSKRKAFGAKARRWSKRWGVLK